MSGDEIYDPVGYSPWWAVLGVTAIVVAVAVVVLIVLLTRRRTTTPAIALPLARYLGVDGDRFGALRATYLARIDDLDREYREGGLDERALHLALSAQMRGFASERLGVDTSAMTLSEIETLRHADPLSSLIAHNYRPSFAEDVDPATETDTETGTGDSVEMARTAVRTW